jgi:predicted nuclease of predicted toxin-antitoxin system
LKMATKVIKLLMDVGVGKTVDLWLLNHGYNVISIRDINPRMSDQEILKIAVTERRMVVTMDKDFGDLVYNSGQAHAGVLLLRLEDANADEKIKDIETILKKYSDKIHNNFCVYKDGKLRIRSRLERNGN